MPQLPERTHLEGDLRGRQRIASYGPTGEALGDGEASLADTDGFAVGFCVGFAVGLGVLAGAQALTPLPFRLN